MPRLGSDLERSCAGTVTVNGLLLERGASTSGSHDAWCLPPLDCVSGDGFCPMD